MSSPDPDTLRALGHVQGQLNGIADLIRETSASTNRRIDDLKETMDDRFQDHGDRITRLENNERGTAIKAAGIGAAAGAVSGIVGQLLGALVKFKIGG
jgi:hypothetical protein